MFCIREGIDGGKRKQRHLLKSASYGLVGASEFNGFRSCWTTNRFHHALYTVFHIKLRFRIAEIVNQNGLMHKKHVESD
ncbi:unnamed protein product [Lasius platythorax]|uniref:Uncharacterized protein n=1 Tax=Lasius platythorax TaxID=488582 RepID=A0AAV2N6X2_9HYME